MTKPVRRRIAPVLLLGALVLAPAAAGAGEARSPLKVELRPRVARPRTDGPLLVEAKVAWEGPGLLTGRLRLEFSEDRGRLLQYTSEEMTFSPGTETRPLLLPPASASTEGSLVRVRMAFATSKGELPLKDETLALAPRTSRTLAIAVCDTRMLSGNLAPAVAAALRLDRFSPEEGGAGRRGFGALVTSQARILPEDFPETPFAWCAFDLAVLTGEGLSLLKESQMKALSRWVEAGGSLLVLAPEAALKPSQLAFLEGIAGPAGEGGPRFSLDAEGRLRGTAMFPKGGTGKFHPGLGRSAVVLASLDPEKDLDTPAFRDAASFLWKVRADQRAPIRSTGHWREGTEPIPGFHRYPRVLRAPESQGFLGQIRESLLPKTIRPIPFWTIAIILFLFVVAIGPGDYYLLGLFRARRLTWVLFPALSLGFTLFTVNLSERTMGSNDYRGSLAFVDVGPGGKVLRQNRFEAIFAAREKDVRTDVRSGFFTSLSSVAMAQEQLGAQPYYYRAGRYPPDTPWQAEEEGDRPPIEGRLPGPYVVTQRIRQWSARMNRIFTLDPPEGAPPLDWDANSTEDFRSDDGRRRVRDRILAKGPPPVGLFLLHGSEVRLAAEPLHGALEGLPPGVLGSACAAPPDGFFALVSQAAPAAGDGEEDLAILDPLDPDAWLLVGVWRKGDRFLVVRRLYREGDA